MKVALQEAKRCTPATQIDPRAFQARLGQDVAALKRYRSPAATGAISSQTAAAGAAALSRNFGRRPAQSA
ncbi:MAG TPA: hypothetical protein VGC36_11825 [Rhizomicrobium sp.]